MTEIKIFWRNNDIGVIKDLEMDMWYCSCAWEMNQSREAIEFNDLVSKFNGKEIMNDPGKGTRIIVKHPDSEINALVISIEDQSLFIRNVYEQDAIDWLIKNVY